MAQRARAGERRADLSTLEPSRRSLLAAAIRLSVATIAWNGAVGASALVVSIVSPSLALAGFALTALLDSSASIVLVWRFMKERRDPEAAERFERRALSWVAAAMLAIATYVGVQTVRGLVGRSHPETSAAGVTLAATTLVALLVNSAFGWWWADPAAALLIAAALAAEGSRIAVRHRFG